MIVIITIVTIIIVMIIIIIMEEAVVDRLQKGKSLRGSQIPFQRQNLSFLSCLPCTPPPHHHLFTGKSKKLSQNVVTDSFNCCCKGKPSKKLAKLLEDTQVG